MAVGNDGVDQLGQAVKILQVNDAAECEIITDNLKFVHEKLKASGAELVSIVSVMGSYRTGKSFLLDLLLRCFRAEEAKNRAEQERKAEGAGHDGETPEVVACVAPEGEDNAGHGEDSPEGGAPAPEGLPAEPAWRFEKKPSGPTFLPDWFRKGDQERVCEGAVGRPEEGHGFAWRSGEYKCTEGIWLWSRPFVFTDSEGRKVGVLLMDTQGAFDNQLSKAQSSTIFGMTALLSAKLIYNVQNKLDDNLLGHFDYVTTFAQKACSLIEHNRAPFGHLHFLVRDWPHYQDGATPEECRAKMTNHLDDHTLPENLNNEDSKQMAERLRASFLTTRCSGFCHPGLHVLEDEFKGEVSDINPNFFKLLGDFTDQLLKVDFPQPSAPKGTEITVDNFDRVLLNYADVFRDSADKATNLRDGIVKVDIMSHKEELLKNFEKKFGKFAPRTAVVDPEVLSAKADELSEETLRDFEEKIRPFRLRRSEQMEQLESFTTSMKTTVTSRTQTNNSELQLANFKLVASPAVGGVMYLFYGHYIVAVCCVSGVAWFSMKKKQKVETDKRNEQVWIVDSNIVQGMMVDVREFGEQRVRDVQAIQVAINRFNANEFVGQVTTSGMMIGQAARMSQSGAQ